MKLSLIVILTLSTWSCSLLEHHEKFAYDVLIEKINFTDQVFKILSSCISNQGGGVTTSQVNYIRFDVTAKNEPGEFRIRYDLKNISGEINDPEVKKLQSCLNEISQNSLRYKGKLLEEKKHLKNQISINVFHFDAIVFPPRKISIWVGEDNRPWKIESIEKAKEEVNIKFQK